MKGLTNVVGGQRGRIQYDLEHWLPRCKGKPTAKQLGKVLSELKTIRATTIIFAIDVKDFVYVIKFAKATCGRRFTNLEVITEFFNKTPITTDVAILNQAIAIFETNNAHLALLANAGNVIKQPMKSELIDALPCRIPIAGAYRMLN